MSITREELERQLTEYRKASRAMMWLYDSSALLHDLFRANDALDPNGYLKWNDQKLTKSWIDEMYDRPGSVSPDALLSVVNIHDWAINAFSDKNRIVNIGSIAVYLNCYLDYFNKEEENDSLSVLQITMYRITSLTKNTTYRWDDLDEYYTDDAFESSDALDSDGSLICSAPLSEFKGVYVPNEDILGDCAVGYYELADLTSKKKVTETIITDINNILDEWCGN